MPTPQAAADTLAMSSLEVDLSGVEEGQTITVKWRGKPVFIKHRTEEDIAAATNVPLAGLRDPQSDAERVVDPKVGCACGEHRAAKRAHNAAHSPLATLRSTGAWVGPRSKPSLQQNPPFCLIRPHPPTPTQYLIVVGVCTHLGCVPIAGAGNYQGWFCPCHGSHYDGSGRTREGPAPYNLEVPEYRFLEDGSKVRVTCV